MELALSNLMRHAFIQGFVKNGGTVTAAIILWPEYNPGECLDRVNESIIQARSQAFEECAKIAEKERRTDLALQHGYKPSWYVVAQEIAADIRYQAIRQHSQKGRDTE